jgi:glycosyltransferase involved in cell wall biosynthesis/tetratricopeptide (TPR) repeat protein
MAWEGDFEGLHSLALVNRALCRGLLDRGHDLGLMQDATGPAVGMPRARPLDPQLAARLGHAPEGGPAQVHVRHRWPPRLEPPPHGRWVLMQPWEFGSLPRAWLPMLRRVDEVWAYSRSVRDAYLEAGVPPERVHVVPLGVDPEVFRPGLAPFPLPPGPSVRFLFVGGTIFRKGIDVLLAAYARAFRPSDGVGLVIKDMGSRSFYRGQSAEARVAELREQGYPVEYIDRDLTEAEMAGLYAACDGLVHPFRGEGFALPVVEAMACGLPVIVTGAGPVLDYATEETAFLIPARRGQFAECRVGDLETIGRPWLSEPDADALVELLRGVAGDPAAARVKGASASAWIRERFTWGRAAEAVEALLSVVHCPLSVADRAGARTRGPWASEPVPSRAAASGDGRSASPGRARVSLTLITRDEEKNLPRCLESVRGIFDEIVVVDTGSVDRTREIAREYGARVFDFLWVDDFAAARNAALARARGDYAFWLDADDVIEPPEREKLIALLEGLGRPESVARASCPWPFPTRAGSPCHDGAGTEPRPHEQGAPAAYVVKCACDPGEDGSGGETVVDHIRLFPVGETIRWTYRVHEQILPALRRAGIPVRWTDLTVRHTGYSDRALRARKLVRDARILRDELDERPADPFVLFNLGAIAIERQEWREALDLLRRSLAGSAPTDSITRKLFALIARAHQMLGEPRAALSACAAGLELDPEDAELIFREAVVRRHTGDPDGARRCWERILTLRRPEQFASVDQGIYGHLTRRNLAALAAERGDREEAARLWRAVLAECPGDREALARLRQPTPAEAAR